MQFGVVFPTNEIAHDPVAVRDFSQAAEDLGYSHLVAYDHVLGAPHENRDPALWGPYTERDPFHEPLVLLAFLAAVTTRIELMTAVLVLPQRQTALVAKQAAELSALSGGRFTLGIGTGWNHVEYEAMGVDFAGRGDRLDEQVELLRLLWERPLLDFSGRFHNVERAGLVPLPQDRIPIWFGGGTPPSLRRAARLGDGFIAGAGGEYAHAQAELLNQILSDAGRDPSSFGLDEMVEYEAGPDAWSAEVEAWEKVGGTRLCIRTQAHGTGIRGDTPPAFDSTAGHIAAIESFMKEVGARS